jgi:hypothetical protein
VAREPASNPKGEQRDSGHACDRLN